MGCDAGVLLLPRGVPLQEEGSTPGESLLSDMRTRASADAPGQYFEELEGVAATLREVATWVPTAVELDDVHLHDSASFDIISTLVDIYGDALFISEYKCELVAVQADL
jgi:hypothetical protein